jgi:cytochrome c-type biogenesis protein CcmH/NrfG
MDTSGRVENLLRMLEGEPSDVFLNYALALEYIKDETASATAESQLMHVLSLDRSYTAAYYQLGKLLERQNRITEALETYRAGLEIAKAKKDKKAGEFEEAIFLLED